MNAAKFGKIQLVVSSESPLETRKGTIRVRY
jgi:hypothetical protein